MKYVHTNLISKDWKTLASFYIQVFDCKMMLPQRDLSGDWLSKGTGVKDAQLKGAHLRLPGYGKNGPTLEIFQYTQMEEQSSPVSNRKGFGHLAFEVENVKEVMDKALQFGAKAYGEITQHHVDQVGTLTFVYIKDPEGNIIELQSWGKAIEYVESNDILQVNTTSNEENKVVDNNSNEEKQNKEEQKISIEVIQPKQNPTVTTTETNTPVTTNEVIKDPNAPKTKQELLDELKKDLAAAKQEIRDAKSELKYTKEDAKFIKDKAIKELQKTPELELMQPKTKEQLLEDLKKEMMLSDEKMEINLNTNLQPTTKQETPVSNEKPLPDVVKIPAVLTVEIKNNIGVVSTLNLAEVELSMEANILAQNLRSFTNLTRPEEHNLRFIEFIGQAFKADTVPLLQQYKNNGSSDENEKAWAILPRLQGSLQHLLSKCEQEPEVLADAKLASIGLSPKDFVGSYKDLLSIVLEAEMLGASHIRLRYS